MTDQVEKKVTLNEDGFEAGKMLTTQEQVKLKRIKREKQRETELKALKKAK